MDVQTAAQLTAEAQALCERLGAAVSEAQTRHEWTEAGRIATVRRAAVRRYGRRLEAWSMAAYGHRVMPEGVR